MPCKLSSCECVVRKDWEARKCLHRALWGPLCSASDSENHLDMSRSQQTCRCTKLNQSCISLSHPNYVVLLLMWSSALLREGPHSGSILPQEGDLHELLLDLMCRFAPDQLLSFLHTSQHYRLEDAIQVLL